MPCGQTADDFPAIPMPAGFPFQDRKSTRLNSSHSQISYAVFCLKKKKKTEQILMVVNRDANSRRTPEQKAINCATTLTTIHNSCAHSPDVYAKESLYSPHIQTDT